MTPLSLNLCGHVTVTYDGTSLSVSALGAKALALLAFLAVERRPHSREEITALLWGEAPDDKAKASLRQALTNLRDAVPTAIVVDRHTVELAPDVESDVSTFLRLAKESPTAAAECDMGSFLGGLHVRHSPAFDEWVEATRAALSRQAGEVLAEVTREAMGGGQWRDAVRFAQRWVGIASLSSAANAALIEARYMSGDRRQALDAFAEYRARLAAETGQPPERSVVELADRIEAAGPAAVRRQATEEWYATAPSFQAPLVGREQEWGALTKAWQRVVGGQSRVALMEGDVGVGKSRLADDFLRWVTAQGGTALRARCFAADTAVPFGVVVQVLRSAVDAPGAAGTDPTWLAEVARVVPELRKRFPSLGDASAESWRLYEGIAQLLAALADEAPVAVLIDDLQWCDAESCAQLHVLIRKLEASGIMWCITFSPGAVERDSPGARLSRAVRAIKGASDLTLRPLREEDLWQMLRGLGRVSAPTGARRLAARIHEVSGGYPFYIIELLKTLFAQGWLTVDPVTGEWIVEANDAGEAPRLAPTVHDAIAERIECLPDELRAVLITIAVSETGSRAEVLSHVHGMSRLRAAAIGDALVDRLLVAEEDGIYRCAHPVVARVVSDGLRTARRSEVHRGLALALELTRAGGSRVDSGEIARHAERGGESALAYRNAMLAVAACEERFAREEALSWLDFAAGVAGTAEESDAVNQATARLLESAGWPEAPRADRQSVDGGRLVRADFDLPVRL